MTYFLLTIFSLFLLDLDFYVWFFHSFHFLCSILISLSLILIFLPTIPRLGIPQYLLLMIFPQTSFSSSSLLFFLRFNEQQTILVHFSPKWLKEGQIYPSRGNKERLLWGFLVSVENSPILAETGLSTNALLGRYSANIPLFLCETFGSLKWAVLKMNVTWKQSASLCAVSVRNVETLHHRTWCKVYPLWFSHSNKAVARQMRLNRYRARNAWFPY